MEFTSVCTGINADTWHRAPIGGEHTICGIPTATVRNFQYFETTFPETCGHCRHYEMIMTREMYVVVNTDTGEQLSECYFTVPEAIAMMNEIGETFDTFEIPLAVDTILPMTDSEMMES